MENDQLGPEDIPVGTPVIGPDGAALGEVREAHPNYLLVGQEGQHEEFRVPIPAIAAIEDGTVRISIGLNALNEVDEVETAHRQMDEE